MNYFEFFDLPITFSLDAGTLRKQFLKNSKKYHPDFYTLESEAKQAEILALSTLNNEAYKVLNDADKRMKYILDIKNILGEEGKNKIPQDFLMDMMDINEELMELEFGFDEKKYASVKTQLERLENSIYTSVSNTLEQYDDTSATAEDLKKIKNYYLKKRYLLRIQENLSKFAPA